MPANMRMWISGEMSFKIPIFGINYLIVLWIIEVILIYLNFNSFDGYLFEYFSWLVVALTVYYWVNFFGQFLYGKNFLEFMYYMKDKNKD